VKPSKFFIFLGVLATLAALYYFLTTNRSSDEVLIGVVDANNVVYRQEYSAGHAEDMANVLSRNKSVTVPYGSFEHALETSEWTPLERGVVEHDLKGVLPGQAEQVVIAGRIAEAEIADAVAFLASDGAGYITGTNLAGTSRVMFGGQSATGVDVVSPDVVTAVSPAGTGSVPVSVTTPGGTAVSATKFRYTPARIAMKELIEHKHLGELREIESSILSGNLRADSERASSWWFERRRGGGISGSITAHSASVVSLA